MQGKKIRGFVLIVCGIAAIIGVKMLDLPALISILLVISALGMFVVGLAIAVPTSSPSSSKDKSS
jgi:uncharacterized membrane protein